MVAELRRKLPGMVVRGLVGAVAGAVVAGGLVAVWVPRTYGSQATLIFPLPSGASVSSRLGLLGDPMGAGTEVPFGSAFPLNTYVAVLKSDRALAAAGRQAGLDRALGLGSDEAVAGRMRGWVDVRLQLDRTINITAIAEGTPRVQSVQDLMRGDAAALRDEPRRELVARMVSALIEQMGRIADEIQLDGNKALVTALQQDIAERSAELDGLQERYTKLLERTGVADPQSTSKYVMDALSKAEDGLRGATGALHEALRTRSATAAGVARAARLVDRLPEEVPFVAERRKTNNAARAAAELARLQYGPESAQVVTAEAALAQSRRELERAVATAQAGLTPELMGLDAELAGLRVRQAEAQRNVHALRARLVRLPEDLVAVTSLQAEIDRCTAALGNLSGRLIQAEGQYSQQGLRWVTLDAPRVPRRKSAPSTMRSVALGAVAGLLLMSWSVCWRLFGVLLVPTAAEPEPGS
ncbi:MAG: hypothetical protein HYU66_14060 [Armatimonadetes bacterium]|nr:hypothetical protein [Armatimonadota bacterium]